MKGNRLDFVWTDQQLSKLESWQFTAVVDHMASYFFKMITPDDEGKIELRIGTTSGGYNIVRSEGGNGSFEAKKGITYYVTTYQYPAPPPPASTGRPLS